jgi:hypothetical protein
MMKKTMVWAILCGALCCAMVLSCAGAPKGSAGVAVAGNWEWTVNADEDNGGSSTIKMEEVDVGGMTARHFSGDITNKYEYGFVNIKIYPADDEAKELLKTIKSFSFKVKGDGQRYAVKMPTADIKDYCYWETVFETEEGKEIEVTVGVDQLIQPTWGSFKNFKQSEVFIVEFQTTRNGNPGSFDLTIRDFKVYK